MESFLLHYIPLWKPFIYAFIFMAMMVEGDIFLFTVAFLTHQGFFDVGDMVFTVFGGVVIGDLVWYWLGVRFGDSPFFLNRFLHRITKPFDGHLLHRTRRTIFISKFTYGIHHALLMRAGALGIDMSKFIKDDIIATVPWIFLVGGLGYVSSASFFAVKHYLRFTEIALLLALFIFVGIEYIARRISKREL